MKTRLLFVPLLVAAVAALSACGGSKTVPPDAIALVGSTPITKTQFNAFMGQAQAQARAAGQPAAALGTPQYQQLSQNVVGYLVQVAELEQAAPKEGVTVTDKDINAYLQSIAKLHYGGSQKKLEAAIKASGLSLASAKQQVKVNLLAQKIKNKVTQNITVTPAEEKQYYTANAAQYATPAQTTRSVEHILVKSKSLANTIEQKLKNGASFAALAKKYSQDPGSAAQGGKYTATKGKEVPAYDNAAFALKTGQLSAPVDATSAVNGKFGWFIIKALGPVKNVKAHKTPFSQVQSTIQQTLLQQKQQAAWGTWLTNLQNSYKNNVEYAAGYAPPTTASVPTGTAPAPTTTG